MTTPKNVMMIIKIKYHERVVYELTVVQNKTFRVPEIPQENFDSLNLFLKVTCSQEDCALIWYA